MEELDMKNKILKLSFLSILVLTSCNESVTSSLNISTSEVQDSSLSSSTSSLDMLPEGNLDCEVCYQNEVNVGRFNDGTNYNQIRGYKLEAGDEADTYYFFLYTDAKYYEEGLVSPLLEVFVKPPKRYSDENKYTYFCGNYKTDSKRYKGTYAFLYLKPHQVVYIRYAIPEVKDNSWLFTYMFRRHIKSDYNLAYYKEYEWFDNYYHKVKMNDSYYLFRSHDPSDEDNHICKYCKGPCFIED